MSNFLLIPSRPGTANKIITVSKVQQSDSFKKSNHPLFTPSGKPRPVGMLCWQLKNCLQYTSPEDLSLAKKKRNITGLLSCSFRCLIFPSSLHLLWLDFCTGLRVWCQMEPKNYFRKKREREREKNPTAQKELFYHNMREDESHFVYPLLSTNVFTESFSLEWIFKACLYF